MSEEQENVPPTSRLPRLATPTKSTGLRPPSAVAVSRPAPLSLAMTVAGEKRKTPSSPAAPPAKRVVSGGSGSGGRSTLTKPTAATARKVTPPSGITRRVTRSSAGSAGTPPLVASSTRTAPLRPATSAATRRPGSAASSASSAERFSGGSGGGGEGARTRPASAAAMATRGLTTTRTGGPARKLPTAPASAVAGPSRTKPLAPTTRSGIGSGMASAAQFKSHDGRLENVEKMVDGFKELLEQEKSKINTLQTSHTDLQNILLNAQNTERAARKELSSASEELAEMRASHAREVEDLERQIQRKDREKRGLEEELGDSRDELGREREVVRELKQTLAQQSMQHMTLSAQLTASQAQVSALQAEVERATLSVSAMKAELELGKEKARKAELGAEERVLEAEAECDRKVAAVEEELRTAETIRRKLHNQVQELKGNIRVFARVRPALPRELGNPEGLADIAYGDDRLAEETGQSHLTITSRSESAMGKGREQTQMFQFDRVFQPKHGQKEVFEEISMLAQSVLDGYNVCIFAYGQTGSGKSWTMEGGDGPNDVGMIPRAIDMIFNVSNQLKDRGWEYTMEGMFLEVYNEVINDLLGTSQFDTKKHEIKIDKDNRMTVTDTVSLPLSNAKQVSMLLERARSRRAVAATLMNERSSRSHSVFALKVKGTNPLTDERCEGILNLVDLAGSERLASSGAGENKDRLKETININKSLSALADVIGALGQGGGGAGGAGAGAGAGAGGTSHVPYRNSTLTRLLQTSLSGQSKTLMFCNLSPLAAHLGETVCSLRFATKVNTTPAGTAKRNIGK